jgi:hypothetical protein
MICLTASIVATLPKSIAVLPLRIALTKKKKKTALYFGIECWTKLDRGNSILKKTVLQNERFHVDRDG